VSAIAQDAGEARAEAASGFGAWNPGVRSQIPGELRELCTIFRPEHSFTSEAEAAEAQPERRRLRALIRQMRPTTDEAPATR